MRKVSRKQHSFTRSITVLFALLFAVIIVLALAGPQQSFFDSNQHVAGNTNNPSPSSDILQGNEKGNNAIGLPAIIPHLKNTPTFTKGDVVKYIRTHRLMYSSSDLASPIIVTQITFLTSRAVSKRLNGETTGVPDDELLCFAELRGIFNFPDASGSSVRYAKAYIVFDAITGNLLMEGG